MRTLIYLLIVLMNFTACKNEKPTKSEVTPEVSTEDIRKDIIQAYNQMYDSYGEGRLDFYDHFTDDFLRISTDGKLQRGTVGPKKEWSEYLEDYRVNLTHYDTPEIIVSPEQVVTIGKYEEYFVNRKTNDSTFNKGTYIGVWKKQTDGTWKIVMDTWHSQSQ